MYPRILMITIIEAISNTEQPRDMIMHNECLPFGTLK